MSGPGTPYIFFRVVQVISLVVCWGILAGIVSLYNSANTPTPGDIVALFTIAILLSVWSFCIIITYLRANNVSYTIAALDLVGMIALIVGVALITNAAYDECVNVSVAAAYAGVNQQTFNTYLTQSSLGRVTGANYGSYCGMLRAAWGLGIANIVFFFLTALIGYQIAQEAEQQLRKYGVARRTIVTEEAPPVVVERPAVRREVIVERDGSRRKKSHSSHHRKSSSRDKDRDRRRRSSASQGGTRVDYYSSR